MAEKYTFQYVGRIVMFKSYAITISPTEGNVSIEDVRCVGLLSKGGDYVESICQCGGVMRITLEPAGTFAVTHPKNRCEVVQRQEEIEKSRKVNLD